MTHVIQMGAFFLQGWVGWGSMCCAQTMTENQATKMVERVKAAGFGNAGPGPLVVPVGPCPCCAAQVSGETPVKP